MSITFNKTTLFIGIQCLFCLIQGQNKFNIEDVDRFNQQAWDLSFDFPDSALEIAKNGNLIADQIGYQKGRGDSFMRMGKIEKQKGNFLLALRHFQKARDIRVELNDSIGMSGALHSMATICRELGKYEEALVHSARSLEIRQRFKLKKKMAQSHATLGTIYFTQEAYDKAIAHHTTSLDISIAEQDSAGIARAYQNIGNVKLKQDSLDQALDFFSRSMLLKKSLDDESGMADLYINMGCFYMELGEFERAHNHFLIAKGIFLETGNLHGLSDAYFNIGELCEKQNNIDSAFSYYEQSFNLVDSLQVSPSILLPLEKMASIQAQKSNFKTAYELSTTYKELKDTIFKKNYAQKMAEADTLIADLEINYQLSESKARHLQSLYERNLIIYGIVVLLIISLLLLIYFRQRLKTNSLKLAHEVDRNRQEVLDLVRKKEVESLNAMLEVQESTRERIAQELHDDLGSLLATIKMHFTSVKKQFLSDTNQIQPQPQVIKIEEMLDHACDKVRKISHEMASVVLRRFGLSAALEDLTEMVSGSKKMECKYLNSGLQARLEPAIELSIYRMVQELVANAIKHGEPDHLIIQVTKRPDSLNIIIEDNGCGISPAILASPKGMGLKNVLARVEKLEGTFRMESTPDQGTSAFIDIPFK